MEKRRKKELALLNKGLFETKLLDTRAKTRTVTTKESILGHLIGPLGLIFVVNTIAALVEKFFTQQTGVMYGEANIEMIRLMGQRYEVVMTAAKILSVIMGLLVGWLLQHTKSRQGRMRPWYLIFGFSSIAIGALIFQTPGFLTGESYWYYFFFLLVCYNTIGSVYFYLFRDTIVSLTSRSPGEKARLQFIRKMSWTLISGIIIGMLINMVVLPLWLEHDIGGYTELLVIMSVVAIPLLLMEYYYTNERVLEDRADNANNIPVKDQILALVKNKYFVIFSILMTVSVVVDSFKGGNVQYFYIKFLLGGEANPAMFTIYQVATGVPVGIGAFAIYPLSKKFGIKNLSLIGYFLIMVFSFVGWLYPSDITVALISGFIRQIGMLPNAYITATLLCYAFDSVEYESNLRLEGLLGVAIIAAIRNLISAPFAGGYESSILKLGFVDAVGVIPGEEVLSFMSAAFYLTDAALGLAYVLLLPFMDVEKKLPEINAELTRRRKAAVEAAGGVWVEPEVLEAREAKEAEEKREADRVKDLQEYCRRKGLDFETENEKYLEKLRRKQEKKSKKSR